MVADIRFGSSGEIVDPAMGDSELREIKFLGNDIEILIVLSDNRRMLIKMVEIDDMMFYTNHVQNVICDIFIADEIKVNNDKVKEAYKKISIARGVGNRIVSIIPTTAPDMICSCKTVEIDIN